MLFALYSDMTTNLLQSPSRSNNRYDFGTEIGNGKSDPVFLPNLSLILLFPVFFFASNFLRKTAAKTTDVVDPISHSDVETLLSLVIRKQIMKGNNFSSSSTILDEIDGKFRPPQSKDGKMARGMGVCCSSLFCPVASCSGQSDEGNKLVRPTEIFFYRC